MAIVLGMNLCYRDNHMMKMDFKAFDTVIKLSRPSIAASPFLSSLLRFHENGDMRIEASDGIIEISMPEYITKEDWQAYLFYLRTGDMLGLLLDQGIGGILSFMGYPHIDASLPPGYRRAIYRDIWAEHRGLDGLHRHNCNGIINPISLLRSISLDHEKVITNGKFIWMTHKTYYMFENKVIYIDGSRLDDYDLEFLIQWKEHGHRLQMIGGTIPSYLVDVCKEIDVNIVRMLCYLLPHDSAIHALCLVRDGILREPSIFEISNYNPVPRIQAHGRAIRSGSISLH